jgi:hypothetical protein
MCAPLLVMDRIVGHKSWDNDSRVYWDVNIVVLATVGL